MSLDEFTLLGDALWLDFVNTARGRSPSPPDLLPDTGAFARWCRLLHLEPESEPIPISAVRGLRDRLTALAEALHAGLQAPAAAIAAGLADADLVALALELRGALADPVPAVGALGDVRAHLGTATPADDAELRGLCHRSRIAPRGSRISGRSAPRRPRPAREGRRHGRRRSRADGGRRSRKRRCR